MHQVILNMLVTKYLDTRVYAHIYPRGETLVSIVWDLRASYQHTIMDTPVQDDFGRYMIFNLASVVDWRVITAAKQRQPEVDNVRENVRQVTHD